ncbi:MAG: AAA family ATPase, partial [Acidobacteria bacterium]|nr:AAA family ATPase [Acidobacteriota bacterium]
RAVRAGLALHARVRELSADPEKRTGEKIRLSTGISTGPVVAQLQDGGKYRLTGEALQISARLALHAGTDEILVSPETQRLIAPFFKTEAGGAFQLKSQAQPVRVYRVECESGVQTRIEAAELIGLTRYAGREQELGTLLASLERASRGEGQFVTVVGEAGIGKSRLLLELRRVIEQKTFTVLHGRCQSYRSNIPFAPFIEALKNALHLQEDHSPEQSLQIATSNIRAIDPNLEIYLPFYLHLLSIPSDEHSLPEHLKGEDLRLVILESLSAIFTLNARRGTSVILLEDWHWVDDGSKEALKKLVGMVSDYPLMIVVTCRPECSFDLGYVGAHVPIHLGSLDAAASRSMMNFVFGAEELEDGLRKLLYERTGGNPFFIEELCRILIEEGRVQVADGTATLKGSLDELHLPDTVQAVIRARIDRLDLESQRTLRHASVIGREFGRPVLERMLKNKARIPRSLEELQALGLIQQIRVLPEAAYRFKHVLTQEVAYDSLLAHQRKSLHEAAGQVIEELYHDRLEEQVELLAHHFSRAENW